MEPEPRAEPPAATRRRGSRLSPTRKLGLGLLLTLVGLFVLGGTIPSAPGPLEMAVAVAATGIVALWLGGILLGSAGRR